MSIKNFLQFVLIMSIVQSLLGAEIIYKDAEISDMKTSMFKSKKENIYYVKATIDSNIIGFSDIDSNKYTDIITYNKTTSDDDKSEKFTFYVYYSLSKGKKFSVGNELFNIIIKKENDSDEITVRNLHVFSFSGEKKPSFLITFNYNKDSLLHYVTTKDDNFEPSQLNIFSNILIMNRGEDQMLRLLYHDGTNRKICRLEKKDNNYYCEIEDFSSILIDEDNPYGEYDISLNGGVGYADLNGNCVPDIVLSHEEGDDRIIEVYTSHNIKKDKEESFKYRLNSIITLKNSNDYGAFALSRVNDKNNRENLPLLDILVPNTEDNYILRFKNQKKIGYTWSKYYCKENKNQNEKEKNRNSQIFDQFKNETCYLEIEGIPNNKTKLDKTFPTVIRMGDFLGSSNPGIMVKQIIDGGSSQISLFKRKSKEETYEYYDGFKMDEFEKEHDLKDGDEFKMGLFYDIAETGSLSFILPTKKGKNLFFFNYRRNIFFVKSKLMNDEDNYFDINVGSTFRYIVTDKKGSRHMDIAYQMIQTSDMNIPLPYSIMGLDDTNNYVEYFQTISGNIIKKSVSTKNSEKNYKDNTPIIPNTQMMISKFYNGKKITWKVDLIVQPMEQIWIFLIIVVIVLLIVLGIIIYLHLKEVKEEQKETNKFKSWFA